MFIDRDSWNEILDTLTSNWVRTLLTAFGVIWGIFILMVLLSAATGMKNGVMKGFGNIATNTMFCWTRTTSMPYEGLNENRRFRYNLSDVDALKKIPNLRYIVPRDITSAKVTKGLNSEDYTLSGDYPEYIKQDPMTINKGRFINYGDIQNRNKICVIGSGVVQDLYTNNKDSIIGSRLVINGVNFMVAGIYVKDSTEEDEAKQIFIPFTTFQQINNTGDKVGWMAITAEDNTPITELKPEIINLLKERHKVHPDDERAIGNFDLYKRFQEVQGLFNILTFAGYFVGFMVLISGVIGVSNIMLIVVRERTKEIGIRRALGASPWRIRMQILTESVFLTLCSGLVGIVIATFVIYIVNYILDNMEAKDIMFANPSVDVFTVFVALIILVASGVFAGMLPAQAAIKVKPVEALRTE